MAWRSLRSRAPRGSSRSRARGRLTRARARATRCCWPPESWRGRRRSRPPSSTRARASATRRAISSLATFLRRRPKATFSKTSMWGKSAYCWKTMLTSRRKGGTPTMSRPCSRIWPLVGSSKPAIMRRVVVLPQPDGPSREKNSPSANSFSTAASSFAASPSSSGTAGTVPAWTLVSAISRPLSHTADRPIRPHGHDGTLAPRSRPSMYEPALLKGRICQIGTVGISSPTSLHPCPRGLPLRSMSPRTPASEDVGGLEGEPALDPVTGPVQVAAGQLGHPADTVTQGVAVHAQGPGGGLPVAVVLQERPQAGHQVAVLAPVVVGQGAEQAAGDGLEGGVLLAGQQQAVAAQVADGGDPGPSVAAGGAGRLQREPGLLVGAAQAAGIGLGHAQPEPAPQSPGQHGLGHRLGRGAGLGRVGRFG